MHRYLKIIVPADSLDGNRPHGFFHFIKKYFTVSVIQGSSLCLCVERATRVAQSCCAVLCGVSTKMQGGSEKEYENGKSMEYENYEF